jgi:hypothetical protein
VSETNLSLFRSQLKEKFGLVFKFRAIGYYRDYIFGK